MKIVIMRHGAAEMQADSDALRNLTDAGHEQARRAGHCLQQQGFLPEQLWVSPYNRARQTARGVLQALGGEGQQPQARTVDTLVPGGPAAAALQAIAGFRGNSLLIVSHQPLVSALVGALTSAEVVNGKAFNTHSSHSRSGPPMAPASMAMLSADEPLAGCCELLWLRHAPTFDISW